MPHMPNSEEFRSAGQESQKDVPEVYDSYYGRYEEQSPSLAPGTPPRTQPPPFNLKNPY